MEKQNGERLFSYSFMLITCVTSLNILVQGIRISHLLCETTNEHDGRVPCQKKEQSISLAMPHTNWMKGLQRIVSENDLDKFLLL